MAARRVGVFLGLIFALALLLAACGGSGSNGHATSTASPSTGTPSPPKIKGLDEALALLQDQPNLQAVIDAVQRKDVDALLSLITWHDTPCGNPHGEAACPTGQPDALVKTAYVGFMDQWDTREEVVRPALEQLLNGEPFNVTFIAKRRDQHEWRGDTLSGDGYFVGFEGEPRPVAQSPVWGDAGTETGLFFFLHAGSLQPIVELGALDEQWTAIAQGFEFLRDLDWFATAPPFDSIPATAKPPSVATFEALIGTPSREGSRIVLEPAATAIATP